MFKMTSCSTLFLLITILALSSSARITLSKDTDEKGLTLSGPRVSRSVPALTAEAEIKNPTPIKAPPTPKRTFMDKMKKMKEGAKKVADKVKKGTKKMANAVMPWIDILRGHGSEQMEAAAQESSSGTRAIVFNSVLILTVVFASRLF